MSVELTWPDAALRLALSVTAGLLVGYDRTERRQPAGLRTTMLVCLAAAVSMIQVNLLLSVAGKAPDSFVMMDLMRLPLGILTGMGFIGAGAILRRGDRISGVTTAATLWMVTVIGLCFGGGQYRLGLAASALCLAAVWGLKKLEIHMTAVRRATVVLICTADGPTEREIRNELAADDMHIESWDVTHSRDNGESRHAIRCEVMMPARQDEIRQPDSINRLARRSGVVRLRWKT